MYAKTYVRILALVPLSVVLLFFIPYYTRNSEFQYFFSNQVVNMGILYAIIVGFLMSLTLSRKQSLEEYVSLELNKIRRIYHLAYNLQLSEPRLKPWFEKLIETLRTYLRMFCITTFSQYEQGNPLFRRVTYTIYALPSLRLPYNSELYQFLLDAAGDATEAREYIREKKESSIGMFQWLVIIVVTMVLSAIIAATTPDDLISRFVSAVVIFSILLSLDLLYEYDQEYKQKNRYLADRYANNLPEIASCDVTTKKMKGVLPRVEKNA
jgi:uncharacterized integral membrane protein